MRMTTPAVCAGALLATIVCASAGAQGLPAAGPDSDLESRGLGPAAPTARDRSVSIYGFADFYYLQWLHSVTSPANVFVSKDPTFLVGNINLYFASELTSRWRTLIEVR